MDNMDINPTKSKLLVRTRIKTRSDGTTRPEVVVVRDGSRIKVRIKHADRKYGFEKHDYGKRGFVSKPALKFVSKSTLNGMVSAFDMSGATSDRLLETMQAKYVGTKRSEHALENAFGVSAGHLTDAMQLVRIDKCGDPVSMSDDDADQASPETFREIRIRK